MTTPLQQAAQSLIERWDGPIPMPTGTLIAELRKALDAELAQSVEPVAWVKLNDDGRTGALFHQNEGWKDASELVPLYLHPPQPQATTAVVTGLLKSFQKVMSWIDNWSPEFSNDPDWPIDRDAARAAIAKAQGEKP